MLKLVKFINYKKLVIFIKYPNQWNIAKVGKVEKVQKVQKVQKIQKVATLQNFSKWIWNFYKVQKF